MRSSIILLSFVLAAIAAPLPPVGTPNADLSIDAQGKSVDVGTNSIPQVDAPKVSLPQARDLLGLDATDGIIKGVPVVGGVASTVSDLTSRDGSLGLPAADGALPSVPAVGSVGVNSVKNTASSVVGGVDSTAHSPISRDGPIDISTADGVLNSLPAVKNVNADGITNLPNGAVGKVVSTASNPVSRDGLVDLSITDGVLSNVDLNSVKNTGSSAISGVVSTVSGLVSRGGALDLSAADDVLPPVPVAQVDPVKDMVAGAAGLASRGLPVAGDVSQIVDVTKVVGVDASPVVGKDSVIGRATRDVPVTVPAKALGLEADSVNLKDSVASQLFPRDDEDEYC